MGFGCGSLPAGWHGSDARPSRGSVHNRRSAETGEASSVVERSDPPWDFGQTCMAMALGIVRPIAYIEPMKSGRVNSTGSLATAASVFRDFQGSWQAVERVARRDDDGVYVIRRSDRPAVDPRPPIADRRR